MKKKSSLNIFNPWLITIWVIASAAFFMTAYNKWQKVMILKEKISSYKKKMSHLDEKSRILKNEIQSADDPIWLELAMMEELGLVPKDAIKLHYVEEK